MIESYKNKVLNMDCLEASKNIPDESVDLIITDPPYGDNFGYGRNGKTILNNENTDINFAIILEAYRILKNNTTMYIFTNWKYNVDIANFVKEQTEFNIKNLLVIHKNNIGMGQAFRNQHEFCYVLEKGEPEYKLNNFSNIVKMGHIAHNDDTHPHEKDVKNIMQMLEHSSNEGDLVLDFFAGSGTTAHACVMKNRDFMTFELDENWFKLAEDKVNKAKGETGLFAQASLF